MVSQKDGGLVSRAVREALGTLVSTQVYGQLVTRSLQASGLQEIPESGRALADWIEGPLSREIESSIGSDAAELVAAQLAPIVAHAAAVKAAPITSPAPAPRRDAFGSEQPTGVAPAPKRRDLARTAKVKLTPKQMDALRETASGNTTRPQAADLLADVAHAPVCVLAATTSRSAIRALKAYLSDTAEVVQVMDLAGLLTELESSAQTSPIVLLDCQRATVHVTSIATIGEDLPRGTAIVLWGASDELWNQIDRSRMATCRWVRCSQEATTDDVGSLCAMLVGSARL